MYRLGRRSSTSPAPPATTPRAPGETHNASFEKTKRFLNGHHFDALRDESSNGTDLVVGLTPAHVWGRAALAARRTA